MNVAVILWVLLGNVKSRRIVADQEPSNSTLLFITVNVSSSPSISKIKLGAKVLPCLSMIALPLLDVKVPLTLNSSPEAGLSVILSTVIKVDERTVIVDIKVKVPCKVFEPLKKKMVSIWPKGCVSGIKNVKLTIPWELELTSGSQVSWNSAETSNPCNGRSPLLDSTIRAVKVTLEPLSATVLIIGFLSINVVTPLTNIVSLPVPVR